jgi:hypothetical protein
LLGPIKHILIYFTKILKTYSNFILIHTNSHIREQISFNLIHSHSNSYKQSQIVTNFAQTVTNRLGLDTEGGQGRGRRRKRAQREAGSRSTTRARSKGGVVEVDSGSVTVTKSLRKRTVAARSEAGVKAAACSGAGDEAAACSGAGIEDGWWHRRHDNF